MLLASTLKSHSKLAGIQTSNLRAFHLALKDQLAQTLARCRRILDPPTRMSRAHQQAPYTRFADQRPTAYTYVGQIARLARGNLAVSQLLGYTRDVVDDILTSRVIDLYEVGARGEWDEMVAFAAGVDFVVWASVNFRSDG